MKIKLEVELDTVEPQDKRTVEELIELLNELKDRLDEE
jgi:hypothetical protein|tara:strand:- start:904 stop:1017 length:114 start_codon:yes stop_codon:yes gene_type:complete